MVFGLGNPGPEYADTRHNAGFMVADILAARWELPPFRRSGRALVTEGMGHRRVVVAKPLTWMNLSGEALAPFVADPDFVAASDLLVISDDFAIPLGTFRLRGAGSSGGHNGLESVEQALGSADYPRLRVGIGPAPPETSRRDFVLGHWNPDELDQLAAVLPDILEAVECWIDDGIETAMSRFNRRGKIE